jgi:hypothetical protein
MTDAGASAAPPEKAGACSLSEEMDVHEREAFNKFIRPEDSYTPEGAYWADLPLSQRVKFIMSTEAKECGQEFSWFWDMFKRDPLSPLSYYFKNAVLPGAGLGLEG